MRKKKRVPDWDVFLYGWGGQTSAAPPLELHYQFVGRRGAWRADAWNHAFERLYDDFSAQMNQSKQAGDLRRRTR